jgi:hypothetical protein
MNRLHRIALGLVMMAGCIDRNGLDIVDSGSGGAGGQAGGSGGAGGTGGQVGGSGGGAGHGGAGGQTGGAGGQTGGSGGGGSGGGGGVAGAGGQTGGTGGSKMDGGTDGPFMCGPVCAIYCPYGNVIDSRGCPTCQCKPPPMCTPVACDLFCKYGYQKDANGCELCKCNPPPTCQPVTCKLLCPNGFEKDANGCEICKCAPATCSPAECGPPPPVAACPGGNTGGCERTPEGKCVWNFRCLEDCSSARDPMTCAIRPACRWLEPGCAEPKLAVAGCYARALIDCNENSCPAGRTCLKRTINACNSTAAAGAADTSDPAIVAPGPGAPAPILPPCACGQPIGICL